MKVGSFFFKLQKPDEVQIVPCDNGVHTVLHAR